MKTFAQYLAGLQTAIFSPPRVRSNTLGSLFVIEGKRHRAAALHDAGAGIERATPSARSWSAPTAFGAFTSVRWQPSRFSNAHWDYEPDRGRGRARLERRSMERLNVQATRIGTINVAAAGLRHSR